MNKKLYDIHEFLNKHEYVGLVSILDPIWGKSWWTIKYCKCGDFAEMDVNNALERLQPIGNNDLYFENVKNAMRKMKLEKEFSKYLKTLEI